MRWLTTCLLRRAFTAIWAPLIPACCSFRACSLTGAASASGCHWPRSMSRRRRAWYRRRDGCSRSGMASLRGASVDGLPDGQHQQLQRPVDLPPLDSCRIVLVVLLKPLLAVDESVEQFLV